MRQIAFGAAIGPESLGSLESEKAGLISTVSLEQSKPREDQEEAEKGKRGGGEEKEELSSPSLHFWLHLSLFIAHAHNWRIRSVPQLLTITPAAAVEAHRVFITTRLIGSRLRKPLEMQSSCTSPSDLPVFAPRLVI